MSPAGLAALGIAVEGEVGAVIEAPVPDICSTLVYDPEARAGSDSAPQLAPSEPAVPEPSGDDPSGHPLQQPRAGSKQAQVLELLAQPEGTRLDALMATTGRIYDANGNRMAPSHSNKRGLRYRYYVSRALLDRTPDKAGKPARIPAIAIEDLVTTALLKERAHGRMIRAGMSTAPGSVSIGVSPRDGAPQPTDTAASDQELVDTMLEHVEIFENRIVITLIEEDVADGTESDVQDGGIERKGLGKPHATARQIIVPCSLGQQPLLKEVIASRATDATTTEPNLPNSRRRNRARLIEAIHRARGWFEELLTGRTATIEIIAYREGRSKRNVSMMLNLAFLAPEIIESILADKMLAPLSASHIAQNLPLDWEEQHRWIAAQA